MKKVVKVKDLKPIHSAQTSGQRPYLEKLNDDELLEAANNPGNGQDMIMNRKTGKLLNGNGRAYELKKRAASANSKITEDTEITVELYDPYDDDLFVKPDK